MPNGRTAIAGSRGATLGRLFQMARFGAPVPDTIWIADREPIYYPRLLHTHGFCSGYAGFPCGLFAVHTTHTARGEDKASTSPVPPYTTSIGRTNTHTHFCTYVQLHRAHSRATHFLCCIRMRISSEFTTKLSAVGGGLEDGCEETPIAPVPRTS